MGKKVILAFVASLILLFATSSCMGSSQAPTKPKVSEEGDVQYRALSLRVLQARLADHHKKASRPHELMHLAGITRVHGHIEDPSGRDVILIGQVDETLPALFTDDLIVALRNSWLKYAPLKGNTYQYSYPGCSIDPNPTTLKQLDLVGERMNKATAAGEKEKEIQEWHRICQSPQAVRVMGVPFDARFGWVMVKADYDLKRIVNGSDSLEIQGLTSHSDMILEQARSDVVQGKPLSIPGSSMNRYWFYPGKNLYEEDEGIALVKQCPVLLLTEEEYLGRKGDVVGKGRPSLFAQKFTENFTERYAEIAQKRSIYTELENLFRFVAVAKIIKFKAAVTKTGLDLNYFFDRHPVATAPLDREVPGISNVKQFSHRRDYSGGHSTIQFWLPSCGGVGINISVAAENFSPDVTGRLRTVRSKVLATRPSPDALFWDYRTRKMVKLEEIKYNRTLSLIASRDEYDNKNHSNF